MELYNGAAHSSDFRAGDADDLLLSFSSGCVYTTWRKEGEEKKLNPLCLSVLYFLIVSLSLSSVCILHTQCLVHCAIAWNKNRGVRLDWARRKPDFPLPPFVFCSVSLGWTNNNITKKKEKEERNTADIYSRSSIWKLTMDATQTEREREKIPRKREKEETSYSGYKLA